MNAFTKISRLVFLCLFTLSLICFSCKSRVAHNEYHDAKVRVSERQLRADKKVIKKGNKAYKKQMRSNRKHLFGRSRAPKA